jgi:hypothetical protein
MDYKDFHSLAQAYSDMYEGYRDKKFHPKNLNKDLKKHGMAYDKGKSTKGDDKQHTIYTKDGVETDLKAGGGTDGRGYSPSMGAGHKKNMKVLNGIDKEIKRIRGGN